MLTEVFPTFPDASLASSLFLRFSLRRLSFQGFCFLQLKELVSYLVSD